jgi:cystathionine gamma-synthase
VAATDGPGGPGRNDALAPETLAAQALRLIDPRTGAVVPGIEPASTFARDDDYGPRQRYIYGRDGGPTVEHAEAVIAALDGAARSLLFASGQAGVTALLDQMETGDHVVAPRIIYHGVINQLIRMRERRGIALDFFDAGTPGSLEAALKPGRTRLVWIETPTNPNWDVIDIAATAAAAHRAGALLAVDCTTAPPCTTRALALGADIAFHSATKYLAGHSDLTAGVISLKDTAMETALATTRSLHGSVIAAFEAWLLIRGIRTLFVRFERASRTAMAIARAFEAHPRLARVLYPGLPAHPGHAIAARQMTGGFGGMLSLLCADEGVAAALVRRVRVWIPATSLGGVESLIEHRKAVEGLNSVVPPELVRLSTGIEAEADLIADLEQALS